MLRLEKVSAAYGAVDALREIDLSIETGEIVALIGSNGAGKSTLLKTISGLVRPSTGVIEFLGVTIAGLPPRSSKSGTGHTREGLRVFSASLGAPAPARWLFERRRTTDAGLWPRDDGATHPVAA